LPLKTHHGGNETWRCDACGAFNDEPLQVCSDCKAVRLNTPSLAKGKKARGKQKTLLKPKTPKTKTPRKKASKVKEIKSPEAKESFDDEPAAEEELNISEPSIETPVISEPLLPEPIDIEDSNTDQGLETGSSSSPQDFVIGAPNEPQEEVRKEEVSIEPQEAPPTLFSKPQATIPAEGHLGLVYVNTPVPELIKRKVDLDFESFSTISLGRSPENVVVIPDAGVSRNHAELRKEGNKLTLKDLQSSNGTYLYDGREFQKVEDTVEVGLNSLMKLGTGTILRLVAE
jgi:FHA domain-containing protein